MIRFLPDLPHLSQEERFSFPDPRLARQPGIVCAGGNLSPGMLLSAYSQGIFPWYSEDEPILWWSPDPRFLVLPETLHRPRRAGRQARAKGFSLSVDRDFGGVISHCASVPRPGQDGTWITDEMVEAYLVLHGLGWAHSVEVWEGKSLAGGLYGLALGSAFFGESMFSLASGASRFAFLEFAEALFAQGFRFIDSQVHTDYLASMGGIHLPRRDYLGLLSSALGGTLEPGSWSSRFPGLGAPGPDRDAPAGR